MDKIFYPKSVAVIGVSEKPDNLAADIIANMQAFGYSGDIHAVGLRRGRVHGIPIQDSVEALPEGIDLAVILTPAATVPHLLEACGRHSIRRAVIESGGFSEFSEEGRALEAQVIHIARRWDMRFVGPNCISVVNMENGLCLPFARLDAETAKRGPVSVIAQSGGVAITYMLALSEVGVGVNKVVSIGNKADLDELDYLAYMLQDPGSEVILLYLESIQHGRRLVDMIAASSKPIIVHKANVSQASAQVAQSHTGALASDDRVVDAALRQVGVDRVDCFGKAAALAQGFVLPPVRGNDLIIVSRSGGHAVVAADAAEAHGFNMMEISDALLAQVRDMVRADVIALTNPLDLGTILDFERYGDVVEKCLRALDPAALMMIHTYSAESESASSRRLIERLCTLSREMDKPVAFCPFTRREEVEALTREMDYPIFTELQATVQALAASRDRCAHVGRLQPLPPPPAQRLAEVEGLLGRDGVLTVDTALGLCASYGIPTAEWAAVDDIEGALIAAAAIGYPVALKALSPDLVHKSDIGGLALGVAGPAELRKAFTALLSRVRSHVPDAHLNGVLVQRMLDGGREVILGGKQDPSFGPVVVFGLGGIYVEVFQDVAFRLAPLTRQDAEEMVEDVRGSRLLHGVRGEPPADIDAVIDALLAISRLMIECPEVAELDVNPLLVFERGASAVDARAIIKREHT